MPSTTRTRRPPRAAATNDKAAAEAAASEAKAHPWATLAQLEAFRRISIDRYGRADIIPNATGWTDWHDGHPKLTNAEAALILRALRSLDEDTWRKLTQAPHTLTAAVEVWIVRTLAPDTDAGDTAGDTTTEETPMTKTTATAAADLRLYTATADTWKESAAADLGAHAKCSTCDGTGKIAPRSRADILRVIGVIGQTSNTPLHTLARRLEDPKLSTLRKAAGALGVDLAEASAWLEALRDLIVADSDGGAS